MAATSSAFVSSGPSADNRITINTNSKLRVSNPERDRGRERGRGRGEGGGRGGGGREGGEGGRYIGRERERFHSLLFGMRRITTPLGS